MIQTNEWQSIDTAPRDGKPVLICGGTFTSDEVPHEVYQFCGVLIADWWDNSWRGEACHSHDNWVRHKPTHWMHLPEPPK